MLIGEGKTTFLVVKNSLFVQILNKKSILKLL